MLNSNLATRPYCLLMDGKEKNLEMTSYPSQGQQNDIFLQAVMELEACLAQKSMTREHP